MPLQCSTSSSSLNQHYRFRKRSVFARLMDQLSCRVLPFYETATWDNDDTSSRSAFRPTPPWTPSSGPYFDIEKEFSNAVAERVRFRNEATTGSALPSPQSLGGVDGRQNSRHRTSSDDSGFLVRAYAQGPAFEEQVGFDQEDVRKQLRDQDVMIEMLKKKRQYEAGECGNLYEKGGMAFANGIHPEETSDGIENL